MVPLALTTVLPTPEVGKRAHARQRFEVHPLEAGVTLNPSIECRIGVNARTKTAFRAVIKKREHIGVNFGEIE